MNVLNVNTISEHNDDVLGLKEGCFIHVLLHYQALINGCIEIGDIGTCAITFICHKNTKNNDYNQQITK